ncbi:MAG: hypothetical protein AAFU85_23490 [Planctomycetota bacterium]
MGLELKNCSAVIKNAEHEGHLHVDSKELLFRSPDLKWSVKVGQGTQAKSIGGDLVVRRGSKSATFRVGANADKWIDKILHPPSRGKKLGLKAGTRYWISGDFESTFSEELSGHGLEKARSAKSCDIAFVLMHLQAELKAFDKIVKAAESGTHLWAVYPKGKDGVGQSEVIARAREHGMGPGKGIAFDETYSAMRFTKK